MTLVLAQTVTAAEGPSTQLLIVFGIIGLAVLVALGGRFFVNLFEVITAPGASLGHHGRNDQFFFSLFVVFLGGLIGSVILLIKGSAISAAFHSSAEVISQAAAQMNPNAIYRDDAMNWGINTMMSNFEIYAASNFIFYPIFVVACWLLAGLVLFMFARLLGGMCTLGDFLGSVAYGSFFMAIGFAMLAVLIADGIQVMNSSQGFSPQPDALMIVGAVIYLYGLVLYLIGVSQSAQMTGGQVIGTVLLYLVVVAVLGYLLSSQVVQPNFEAFQQRIQAHNPARG